MIAAMELVPTLGAVLMTLGVVVAGLIVIRTYKPKVAEARLEEKNAAIDTHLQTIEALRERDRARDEDVKYLRDKVTKTEAREVEARAMAAEAKGRYEEQKKYTAEPAFRILEDLLERSERESERRHTEVLAALHAILESNGREGPRGPAGRTGREGASGREGPE